MPDEISIVENARLSAQTGVKMPDWASGLKPQYFPATFGLTPGFTTLQVNEY